MKKFYKLLFSESIFIGLITMLGYIAAYVFETAYLAYFSLPLPVTITVSGILLASAGILFAAFIIISILEVFSADTLLNPKGVLGVRIRIMVLVGAYVWFRMILFNYSLSESSIYLLIFFMGIILYFILPIIYYPKAKSLKEKMELDWNRIRKFDKETILTKILSLPYSKWLILLIICVVLISNDMGRFFAYSKDTYSVLNYNEEELAVIRQDNENFFAMPFDSQTQLLKEEYYILSFEEITKRQIPIRIEKLGRLKTIKQVEKQEKLEANSLVLFLKSLKPKTLFNNLIR